MSCIWLCFTEKFKIHLSHLIVDRIQEHMQNEENTPVSSTITEIVMNALGYWQKNKGLITSSCATFSVYDTQCASMGLFCTFHASWGALKAVVPNLQWDV